jgi:hypothetical protein
MDDRLANRQWLRRLWAGSLNIITLCVQYTGIIMASQQAGKAFWNDQEVIALLDWCTRGYCSFTNPRAFEDCQNVSNEVDGCTFHHYNLSPCTDHLLSSSVYIMQSKLIAEFQEHTGTTI